jgi:hypothetical protein
MTPWAPVHGAQVPGVLHLVQGEEERWLPPPGRDLEQIAERRIARAGDPGHHPLVVDVARHRGELVAGPIRDLHALALGQAQELVQGGPAAL